ncbi:cysteine-rich motor neuron 1 protein-like [Penaeus chinensis]|uniref:cysteine-rich motor neuron 1 protein-like n=1 Tax=Penaeus chinensis TaxID=139456 RepID=UPI001FB6D1FE|nr:cysteine-rich motor neuron 1 protein-like [Penaeus chinensis]
MSTTVVTLAVLALLAAASVDALTCRPCNNVRCASPETYDCPGREVVPNECGCCFVCSKLEGESCGGSFSILGTCSSHLVCYSPRYNGGTCMTAEQAEWHRTSSTTPASHHGGPTTTTTTPRPYWLG